MNRLSIESSLPQTLTIVVLVEAYLPILGGAQNNVQDICRRLLPDGFRFIVLTRQYTAEMKRVECIDGVEVNRSGYFPIRTISKLLWFLSVLWYLLHRRSQYDLVLCVPIFYWPDLLPAYLSSLFTRKPYLMRSTLAGNFDAMLSWSPGSILQCVKKLMFPPFLWRSVLNRATAIVVQTEFIRDRAQRHRVQHCEVIANGVDTKRFVVAHRQECAKLRRRLNLPNDKTIVACAARFVVQKNQITLLRAVKRMAARDRPYVLLLGITEHNRKTANEMQLREYIDQEQLGDIVQVLKDLSNVEDYLRASDIFVFPTRFDEGLSNALLEAMSCGLPCVCSDLPQIQCIFPEGQGVFFPADDAQALSERLTALTARKGECNSLGSSLASLVREKYSIARSSVLYGRVFRACVDHQAGKSG